MVKSDIWIRFHPYPIRIHLYSYLLLLRCLAARRERTGWPRHAEHMRPPCSEPCCRRTRQRATKPARGTAGVCLCDQRGKGRTQEPCILLQCYGGQFQMLLRTRLVYLLPRYSFRILICGKEKIVAEAAIFSNNFLLG